MSKTALEAYLADCILADMKVEEKGQAQ